MQMPMTPDQFTVLQQRAGVAPDVTSGTVTQQGVTAEWGYASGILTATILKKPRLLSESFIMSRFRKWAGLP
jgi:hypothetical protein